MIVFAMAIQMVTDMDDTDVRQEGEAIVLASQEVQLGFEPASDKIHCVSVRTCSQIDKILHDILSCVNLQFIGFTCSRVIGESQLIAMSWNCWNGLIEVVLLRLGAGDTNVPRAAIGGIVGGSIRSELSVEVI